MGIVNGVYLGGKLAMVAQLARTTAATAATAAKSAFKEELKVYEEQVVKGEVPVDTTVALAVVELVAEAAAAGIAAIIPYIDQDVTTVVGDPNWQIAMCMIVGYNELKTFISEFFTISGIYRAAATESIGTVSSKNKRKKIDGNVLKKKKRKKNIVNVLQKIEYEMEGLNDWLIEHQYLMVKLKSSVEPFELVHIIIPLIAGIGNLKRLADDVNEHQQKKPITDTQLDSFERGVNKVVTTCRPLAWYMAWKETSCKMAQHLDLDLFLRFITPEDVLDWEKVLQRSSYELKN